MALFLSFIFFLILLKIPKVDLDSINYNPIIFDTKKFLMKGQFAINSKGDMIIEFTSHEDGQNNYRLFYGIKKDGSGFFDGKYMKEIYSLSGPRYEAQNLFVSLNNSKTSPQYLISLGSANSIFEIYNIEGNIDDSNNYVSKSVNEIFGHNILSFVNALIDLKNAKHEYLLAYINQQDYIIKKFAFSGLNLDNIIIDEAFVTPRNSSPYENRMVDAITINDTYILVLRIVESEFKMFIFDYEFKFKRKNIILDNIIKIENNVGLFAKGIELNQGNVLFVYYKKENYKPLLSLGYVTNTNFDYKINLNITLSEANFKTNPMFNKLIKINSKRCAFIGFKTASFYDLNEYNKVSNYASIFLIDIYNDYKSITTREYKIDYNNYKTHKEIDATIYNGFLCFTTSVYNVNDLNLCSLFLIFGYFNETKETKTNNITLNIYEYLGKENNNNIIDIILSDFDVTIENNIFGYEPAKDKIKLVTIPTHIEFYNKDPETKLNNDDILSKAHYILEKEDDIVESQYNSYFEYQRIIQEPDYSKINSYPINISDYHYNNEILEDQGNSFQPQFFYGKTLSVNFIICPHNHIYSNGICQEIITPTTENMEVYKSTNIPTEDKVPSTSIEYKIPSTSLENKVPSTSIEDKVPSTYIENKVPSTSLEERKSSDIITDNIEIKETTKNNICSYDELLKNNCTLEVHNNTNFYNQIINEIIQSYPDSGKSVVIKAENDYIYQVTTLNNELSSLNGTIDNPYNLSIIDLGECEDIIRDEYNISENVNLIFLKYEKMTEVVSKRDVQYEVYHSITKDKLNISICDNTPIIIYIPVSYSEETQERYIELNNQGYDLFNREDSFYNDLCTPFKSNSGTDVGLNDRRIDYYKKYNNNTECQQNCKYEQYNVDIGYLKCKCNADDGNIEFKKKEKFENNVLYKSFYDTLKNSNYKVVKCYNLVFNSKIILKNYGNILVLAYFFIYFIFFLYFIFIIFACNYIYIIIQ